MRVLIAGAGDLGSRVARRLHAAGHQVTAFTRSGDVGAIQTGIDVIRADLAHSAQIAALVQQADAIIFTAAPTAARNEDGYRALYVAGLENLANARTTQPIMFCSSTAVYSENRGGWVNEMTKTEPEAFNGRVLVQAENVLRTGDIALRLGGIYGPERTFARRQALAGVAPNAGQWTNRIHIDDAAAAICFALMLPMPPRALNVTDDQPCTQQTLYDALRAKVGLAAIPSTQPATASGKRVSNALLRRLGFICRYQSYADGYASFE